MSTLLSLAALAALALTTFEANKDTEKVFATADGNIFLSENYARNHGRQEKLEVYTITRAEAEAAAASEDAANAPAATGGEGGADAPAPDAPAAADTGKAKKAAPAAADTSATA